MLSAIGRYVLTELRGIAAAPVTVLLAIVLMVTATVVVGQWSYSARIEDLDRQLRAAQRELNDYRGALQVSPGQAKARIDALEDQLNTLRMRVEPRTLTGAQRQALIDHVTPRGTAPFTLTIEAEECPDCSRYAADFADVLHSVRLWKIRRGTDDPRRERPRHGIGIRVQDPLRPPPQAVILREAIQLAGLQVDMLSGAVVTEVHLVIAAPARTGIN